MQKCNENAANRYSYVGEVYNVGERKRKEEILNSLPIEWSDLHKKVIFTFMTLMLMGSLIIALPLTC